MLLMYTVSMKAGQFVLESRRRAGLSQRTLASRAGVSKPLVARIERGDIDPSFDRLLELVRACGFDLEIHVVPLDEDSWTLVERGAQLSPQERLDRMLAGVEMGELGRLARERNDA
jgi:transcriptional regulator with XRE-family HTH domain